MSKPVIKVAKPKNSLIGLEAKDFALNTDYLLPKIYRQVTVTGNTFIYNSLGYPHGHWAFRRLNQYSYYHKDTPEAGPYSPFQPVNWFGGSIYDNLFTGNEYTFFKLTSMPTGDVGNGVNIDSSSINITVEVK